MGGPSTKDYAPVPVDEHIDDGVEAPRDDAEVSEDEGLYNTSAPLLSNRSRENESPRPSRGKGFFKICRWNPFRRCGKKPAWLTSNSKGSKRSKRSMFIAGFIGFLLLTVVALSTSTAILAKRPKRCSSCYNWRRTSSRVPFSENYRSSSFSLNFPQLYPPLTSDSSGACRKAWNTLRPVPCHEKIWNRSWDNGKHESIFEPDVSLYAGPLCGGSCPWAIARAYQLIKSQCTSEDKFDMEGYVGAFTADPGLEDGPIGVIETLKRRIEHTCRVSPAGNGFGMGHNCPAELYKDWFIIDGMNSGNLEGLDIFEAATRTSKTVPGHYSYQGKSDQCDNAWDVIGNGFVQTRRFGPGEDETTCSWCLVDWFDRKLQSWAKGKVVDPRNGSEVELPDYLHRIKHAGRRCGTEEWNRIYGKAILKYKSEGLLPPDWEDTGRNDRVKKPCDKKPEWTPALTADMHYATPM
ncbi:hypothetical protein AOQ84DRAFT_140905 [Glonium stellatum]|uniref:Uncharacterized protein n=1 Tax=Glonium stellatum TaxID=574774 RepID=A0A8E2ERW2_9PEZI|nr:hypothetical protein AOQ84DRAFT_140905 [Glonium stellatum]